LTGLPPCQKWKGSHADAHGKIDGDCYAETMCP